MTISLQRALEHMAWANQEIYKLIAELPDEALDAYATDPEFTVREILRHIASSSGGYASRKQCSTQSNTAHMLFQLSKPVATKKWI
jgi:uncharacterized damage-inducible protein DinB